MTLEEHHLQVPRTARYYTVGDPRSAKSIWLVLHGYGQLARFFLNAFAAQAEEHHVVAPEGLSRFYLDADHQRVGATWMTREDRENEILDQVAYLDRLVTLLRTEMPALPVHVLGFSQGVATMGRWLALGRTRPVHALVWGGSLPPELTTEKLRSAFNGMRVDLVHGLRDELVPEAQFRSNEERLVRAEVPVTTHVFPGGHKLDPVILDRCMNAAPLT